VLTLITNSPESTTIEIAPLYRLRWQIARLSTGSSGILGSTDESAIYQAANLQLPNARTPQQTMIPPSLLAEIAYQCILSDSPSFYSKNLPPRTLSRRSSRCLAN
jgi:hypothetical protein